MPHHADAPARDAFQGLNRFVFHGQRPPRRNRHAGHRMDGRHVDLHPNANSIVPAGGLYDPVRDAEDARLDRMTEIIYETARETAENLHLEGSFRCDLIAPTRSDAFLVEAMAKAAERLSPRLWRRMPSGALHDAQMFQASCRWPCCSYHPRAASSQFRGGHRKDDLALGAQVLCEAVTIWNEHRRSPASPRR